MSGELVFRNACDQRILFIREHHMEVRREQRREEKRGEESSVDDMTIEWSRV